MGVACLTGVAIYKAGKKITEARNIGRARKRIDPKTKCQIGNYFPNLNLNKIKYVESAKIPENYWTRAENGAAITFGYTIYFASRMNFNNESDFRLLIHELVHCNQYRRVRESETLFACGYYEGLMSSKFNVKKNAWERIGYARAKRFDYDNISTCNFNGEIYGTKPNGKNFLLYAGEFRKSWDTILSGEFGGTGNRTDLFFYDRKARQIEFYRVDPDAKYYLKRKHKASSARSTWKIITSGEFGGTGGENDLMFYDANAQEIEFYRVDSKARNFMRKIKGLSRARKSWDIITSGQFGGGEYTDLMFYDRKARQIEFYRVDPTSKHYLKRIKKYDNVHKSWDMIVPCPIISSRYTELLFYDRNANYVAIYRVDPTSKYFLKRTTIFKFSNRWDIIVPGLFGNPNHQTSSLQGFFCYSRALKKGEFYARDNKGKIILVRSSTGYRNNWDIILRGNFGGRPGSLDDLLFYSRTKPSA